MEEPSARDDFRAGTTPAPIWRRPLHEDRADERAFARSSPASPPDRPDVGELWFVPLLASPWIAWGAATFWLWIRD